MQNHHSVQKSKGNIFLILRLSENVRTLGRKNQYEGTFDCQGDSINLHYLYYPLKARGSNHKVRKAIKCSNINSLSH
jgi:hypothetical protein